MTLLNLRCICGKNSAVLSMLIPQLTFWELELREQLKPRMNLAVPRKLQAGYALAKRSAHIAERFSANACNFQGKFMLGHLRCQAPAITANAKNQLREQKSLRL